MHRDDEIEARQNGRKTADKDADACCYHVKSWKMSCCKERRNLAIGYSEESWSEFGQMMLRTAFRGIC